jgi:plastocyanin
MSGGELRSLTSHAMNRRRFIARLGAVAGGSAMLGFADACGGGEPNRLTAPGVTGTVRGTVVDLSGKPQGIGRIYLLAKSGFNAGVHADVDASGDYDFGSVAAGEYQVRFWGANLASVPEPLPNPVRVTVKPNETTVVLFQIQVGPSEDADVDVYAGDYFFQAQPAGDANGTVVAKLGTTICWYNVGQTVHSVTGGPWGDSGPIALDGNFMWTADQVGTFPYRCRYHGTQMIATLQIIP